MIRQLQGEVQQYQELAFEVAAEHEDMSKTSSLALKKAAAADETAKKILLKTKDAAARIDSLQDEFDDFREEMDIRLVEAHEEILSLKQELARKTEEVEEFEVLSYLASRDLDDLAYNKVEKLGKPKTWSPIVTQLVVEMLANGTPPSAVSANILSVCKLLFPGAPIVRELPSIRFVRSCRTVLLHLAKTLAAYEIASTDVYEQLFTDGTTRRQTEFQNVIIGVLTPAGYRRVALDGCILSEEHNAESVTTSILV